MLGCMHDSSVCFLTIRKVRRHKPGSLPPPIFQYRDGFLLFILFLRQSVYSLYFVPVFSLSPFYIDCMYLSCICLFCFIAGMDFAHQKY